MFNEDNKETKFEKTFQQGDMVSPKIIKLVLDDKNYNEKAK